MAKHKVTVEILTERKVLDVRPGYFQGSADRVEVDVCVKCAAIVFDPIAHDTWHRSDQAMSGAETGTQQEWGGGSYGDDTPF